MASSPRLANLNLSGGVKDLQVRNQHRSPTNLPTHALKESSRLATLWWGGFPLHPENSVSSRLHKQTGVQCQEDPGSQALMAFPSQNHRYTRQCTCVQTRTYKVLAKGKQSFKLPYDETWSSGSTSWPRASNQALRS